MRPFTVVSGQAAPLLQANIDTDVIIRIERLTARDQSRLGDYALEALRFRPDGSEDPDFVLNRPRYREAPILLSGPNFGCGSSREGAVTALLGRGVRAIVAPSYGDIFYANCFQNGLLPVRLPEPDVEALARETELEDRDTVVSLVDCAITSAAGRTVRFEVDPRRREALLKGLDDIGLTSLMRDDILAWQARDRVRRPWVWTAAGAKRP